MSQIWFSSDFHFYHFNILKYCNRPFKNLEEMHITILNNINSTVNENDIFFIVGDMTIKRGSKHKPYLSKLFGELPGQKHLIVGNHDYYTRKFYIEQCGFLSVNRKITTKQYIITHDPKDFGGDCIFENKILIHGHVHAHHPVLLFNELSMLNGEATYDVGVDANNFKPVSLKYIKEYFKKPYERKPKYSTN